MYVYDKTGKQVLKREYADGQEAVNTGFHMPDGSVILLVGNYEKGSTDLIWYDVSSMKPKVVQTLEGSYIPCACITEGGYLYYMSTSRIYAWNVSGGEQTKLFDCMRQGIEYAQMDALTVASEGKIALYSTSFGKTDIYLFSDEEIQTEEDAVRMVSLENFDNYLNTTVASFSRKYPDMAICVEKSSDEKDAYHDRIMAELVSGKGPDLLWVNVEDMQILYEKGALQSLDELISEETLKQIFPGIVTSGSIDGKLMGVYFDTMPIAFLVNKELLGKENWEIADLNAVAAKNPQIKGLMTSAFTFDEGVLLSILALNDLENCPYLDWTQKKSDFNSGEFVELLEHLKRFGTSKGGSLKKVCDGEYLAYRTSIEIKDLVGYSEVMAQCGASCLVLGFPGSGQSTGCWMNESFLVVNAASNNKEVIGKFLEYAFSPTAQKECTLGSVRKDAVSSQVYVHEYFGYYAYGPGAQKLEVKENGETFLEEYLLFLENCAPLPQSYEMIEDIVLEEVEVYFSSNCTAEQAAEKIDNRVQLYLDERY